MGEPVVESGQSGLDDGADRGNPSAGERGARFSQTYPAVADSVAAIRATVAQFATQVGTAPFAVEAVKLAVSEAATNVVVHAYASTGQPGRIEVEATHTAGELRVTVADTGTGLQPGHERRGLGLGLAIIKQLADQVELLQGGRYGLRVVMRFLVPPDRSDPGRPSASLVARISLLGHLTGLAFLLHDHIVRLALDDPLDRRDLVASSEHKVRGARPHVLIRLDRQLDQRIAAQTPALAQKRHRLPALRRPLASLDALVDLSKHGLVMRNTVFSIHWPPPRTQSVAPTGNPTSNPAHDPAPRPSGKHYVTSPTGMHTRGSAPRSGSGRVPG
jgi:serine/threonine-protein kinase RsbW